MFAVFSVPPGVGWSTSPSPGVEAASELVAIVFCSGGGFVVGRAAALRGVHRFVGLVACATVQIWCVQKGPR